MEVPASSLLQCLVRREKGILGMLGSGNVAPGDSWGARLHLELPECAEHSVFSCYPVPISPNPLALFPVSCSLLSQSLFSYSIILFLFSHSLFHYPIPFSCCCFPAPVMPFSDPIPLSHSIILFPILFHYPIPC